MPHARPRRRKPAPKCVLALLDLEQAKAAVTASLTSASGQRTYDHAMLIGCGLRRGELPALQLGAIQQREDHWVIADLVGKGGHLRTGPGPRTPVSTKWRRLCHLAGGELDQTQTPWASSPARRRRSPRSRPRGGTLRGQMPLAADLRGHVALVTGANMGSVRPPRRPWRRAGRRS